MRLMTCLFLITLSWGQISEGAVPVNVSANDTLNASLFTLPDTRQSTEYSCGAAAMQAVLGYWGRDIGEEDVIEMLNTNAESGTYPDDIIRVAEALGLQAEYEENMTLADLENYVAAGNTRHSRLPGVDRQRLAVQ